MVVPFVYDLDVSGGSDYNSLSIFHFYLQMCIENNLPLISHERYFQKSSEFLNDWGYCNFLKSIDIDISLLLSDENNKINKYAIAQEVDDKIISSYPSQMTCWQDLLQKPNAVFENEIIKLISKIELDFGEKIEAFLCFYCTASLRKVANEKGIPIIFNERSSFRPKMFISTGYFDLKDCYGYGELEDRYKNFIKNDEISKFYFDRKEIFALFMTANGLNYLPLINEVKPVYELGICRPSYHGSIIKDGVFCPGELDRDAHKFYSNGQIKYRERTDPETALEFILSCKRIASVHSNMSFDAMLLGRTSCSYGQSPFSFMANNGIKDAKEKIAPIDFINFVVFGYFVPWQLISDVDYIKWRLSKPSEIEIYNKHLDFYLEQRGLTRELFKQHKDVRLEYILKNQNVKPFDLRNRMFKLENNIFLINGIDENNIRKLFKEGISFGPYWELPCGNYSLKIAGENLSAAEFNVYYCKGQKHVDFVKIVDSSLVELKFTVEEKISDIEFVIRNKSENGISIYSIELSGSEKRLRNEN